MWHHYKENKLIGIMKWDSLPEICHKWWEQAQDYSDKKSHFSNLKKEDLVFCYDNLRSLDSFDEYQSCQMPYCLGHCDSSENRELNCDYLEKDWKLLKAFTKKNKFPTDREWTDEQEELYRKERLPEWVDTKEYLDSLRKYLDDLRQNLIKHPDKGYNEYIIYKERDK